MKIWKRCKKTSKRTSDTCIRLLSQNFEVVTPHVLQELSTIYKLILSNKHNYEHMAKYFKELLSSVPSQNKMTFQSPWIGYNHELNYLIQLHQIRRKSKNNQGNLENNKASGKTQSFCNFLNTGLQGIGIIQETLPTYLAHRRNPTWIERCIIHPLDKKGGKMNINNCRNVPVM